MKVLVVDDEAIARRRLVRMLGRLGEDVVGEAADGRDALSKIQELNPDAVLLDIRMPGLSGLELARTAPNLPPIVFTTAYDEYAVQAFEADAVDYLLKPIQPQRLEAALAKVSRQRPPFDPQRLSALLERALNVRDDVTPRVTARAGKTVRVFDARTICRFHASDRYTLFRHKDSEFVLDESLNTLEKRLARHGFVRVHRSELVNLECVEAVYFEEGSSEVALTDGQTAPVSRRLAPELKRRLGMSPD
jgi:DNA-binding LytR/AlgR family response regulator